MSKSPVAFLFRFALLAAALVALRPALASERTYAFNVLNHRSTALTAEYWNPMLRYVSEKTGITLELKLNRTSRENTAKAETGIYDFLYTNHFFTPQRERLGYRVIARPAGPGIRGEIVVSADSPIRTLRDLEGKQVSFATPDGFAGYTVSMDALLNAGVRVQPAFAGNMEAAIGLVRRGEAAAAGVNSRVVEDFSRRTTYAYRVLWNSPRYHDLAIMANPHVPKEDVAAIQAAFVGMAKDPRGRQILAAGAQLLKNSDEQGFVAADNRDYESYRAFYRQTRIR